MPHTFQKRLLYILLIAYINLSSKEVSGSLSAKSVLTVACVYSHRVRADTNIYTLRAKCDTQWEI